MKSFLHFFSKKTKKLLLTLFITLLSINCFSQIQLSFTGIPTVTGTPGAVGAKYTYANVGSVGPVIIKAEINIVAITGGAVLANIDGTAAGSANAWQPIINGSQTSGNCWGIEFLIDFFDAGTSLPLTLSSFKSSGVDIDGDGGTLREYNTFYSPSAYTVENPTSLTITNLSGNYEFKSPQTQYPGIALTQTNVAVTCLYNVRSSVQLLIGSCCVAGACTATGTNRLHSINFFDAIPYTSGTTLPVKLTSFSATKLLQGNLIAWKSAEEINLSKYILQYSSDGINFIDFASINSTGSNTSYSFVDNTSRSSAITYYRLKSIDTDGRTALSNILVIKNDKILINNITATPGPFKKDFNITLQSNANRMVDFRIINMDGKTVKSIRQNVVKGTNIFLVENNSTLPSGVYLLLAVSENGVIAKTKIVKQ